jgi:type IV secretory pathway VirB2 component (pilin)
MRRPSYDYQEPTPRGAWFEPDNTIGRRRAEKTFRIVGILLGLAVGLYALFLIMNPATGPRDAASAVLLTIGALAGGAFAYFVVFGIGVAVTGVSWLALLHDLRLRSIWSILLEIALFLSAAAMMVYSFLDAVKHGSAYSACVFTLIACLTWWPYIRHRIRHQRWPD